MENDQNKAQWLSALISEFTLTAPENRLGQDTYACGLCQAGVPCTYGIPDKEKSVD